MGPAEWDSVGSGLGGLDWRDVRPEIEDALRNLDDVRIVIFEPQDSSARHRMTRQPNAPKMTPGRAALVALVRRYIDGFLDPFVTFHEVHKLMYFMKASGESSLDRLQIAKGRHGPYVRNLNQVLSKIEGHFISGDGGAGDAPNGHLELVPGAVDDAEAFLDRHPAVRLNVNRVASLMEGFETPTGLELLSTTHWVIDHEQPSSMNGLMMHMCSCESSKPRFSSDQINLATRVLREKGWIAHDMLRANAHPP